MFSIVSGSKIKNKSELPLKGEFPVYSSDSNNNGIVGFVDIPTYICDEENKFFVVFGDHTRTFNIANKSFSILDNVKVLKPVKEFNLKQLLFVVSSWKKEIPNLGYARHWKIAKDVKISLPTKNGEIDFDFMENFISQLEAYLLVTGLKDYTLTTAEQQALADFQNGKIQWGTYRFEEIFDNIKQGRRLKKDDQIAGDIPFVMAGVTNTGVVNYISNPVASFTKNSITIDIFGNAFYRNYDFGAGDDTGVYWNAKTELSKEVMLFLTKASEKALEGKFSYGKKLRSSQSLKLQMMLPTQNNAPNYDYMALLISAIQKLVIKDVVLYADRKIEATKKVIQK
ncbi:type I restriction modification protein [Capnocytophaga catalasegens]|uniref:Type I restriction modification protein n=1 Tax=Capnocytophaga catalasegens TaxID=1004260 RepID=A0AAV5ATK1_9FLAO|nr:type I restriction modification protein [Capnocytophaga catalasegens]GJM50698.1 type I restriction modification protein [Capnocytophaga catalasegens]GJM51851.1 type I restriction modification protein [Capnocytophaga catalasegens]